MGHKVNKLTATIFDGSTRTVVVVSGISRFTLAALSTMAHRLQTRCIMQILARDWAVGQTFVPTLMLITRMENNRSFNNPHGLLDNMRPVIVVMVVSITINYDWHN